MTRREALGDVPAPAAARARREEPQGVSYAGLLGGVLGVAALVTVTIGFALSDDKQDWALLFGPLALSFVPAIIVSAADLPHRATVLRLSTVLSLVVGLGGFAVDPALPLIMGPSTVLLATGAGLIFQGRRV